MAQYELGDVVHICGERVTITDRQHEDGRWLYRVNHATKPFWQVAWWAESMLTSEADYEAKVAEQEAQPKPTPEELRQARLEYVQSMRENGAWWYGRQGIGWD